MQLPSLLVEHPLVGVGLAATLALLAGNLVAMGYWAHRDATARDGSVVWTFVYLSTGVGVLHYAWVRYVRGDNESRAAPPTKRERLASAYTVAVVVAVLLAAVVSPPDPVAQVLAVPPLFALAFAASYLLVYRDALGRRETPA